MVKEMVNNQLLTVSKLSRLQRDILTEFKKGQWYGDKDTGRVEQVLTYTEVLTRIAEKRSLYRPGLYGFRYIFKENSLRASVNRSLQRLVSREFLKKQRHRFYDDIGNQLLLWRAYELTPEGIKYLSQTLGNGQFLRFAISI